MIAVEKPAAGATNRWLVLVIVCLAQFMVVLDATVVNVALPSIQADLGFSAANLQWVIIAYTVLSTLAADKSASVLADLGRAPDSLERANALLDGFQVAFVAAAILVTFGAVLLMLAVRKSDVANVDPDATPLPA